MFESVLYSDPQAAKPACFCPRCGAECYWPSRSCIRCERKKKADFGNSPDWLLTKGRSSLRIPPHKEKVGKQSERIQHSLGIV